MFRMISSFNCTKYIRLLLSLYWTWSFCIEKFKGMKLRRKSLSSHIFIFKRKCLIRVIMSCSKYINLKNDLLGYPYQDNLFIHLECLLQWNKELVICLHTQVYIIVWTCRDFLSYLLFEMFFVANRLQLFQKFTSDLIYTWKTIAL